MWKKMMMRTAALSTAIVIAVTAVPFAGYAAYDDMDAVSLAKLMAGKDYQYGSETPREGFDSAGFIYYVFRTLDYSVPRDLKALYNVDKTFIKSQAGLLPGDVVFYGSSKSRPSFTAIYVGNNKIMLASKSRDEVIKRSLSDYSDSFLGARRILSPNDRLRVNLVLDAIKYLGVPYVFGAKFGQTKTFDCSSFMKTIFDENGIYLPRVSRDQAKRGEYVRKSDLKVGDLVFFTTPDSGSRIGHVGLYVGNGDMIHTFGDGGVKYTSIYKEWWKDHYVTARRIIN